MKDAVAEEDVSEGDVTVGCLIHLDETAVPITSHRITRKAQLGERYSLGSRRCFELDTKLPGRCVCIRFCPADFFSERLPLCRCEPKFRLLLGVTDEDARKWSVKWAQRCRRESAHTRLQVTDGRRLPYEADDTTSEPLHYLAVMDHNSQLGAARDR